MESVGSGAEMGERDQLSGLSGCEDELQDEEGFFFSLSRSRSRSLSLSFCFFFSFLCFLCFSPELTGVELMYSWGVCRGRRAWSSSELGLFWCDFSATELLPDSLSLSGFKGMYPGERLWLGEQRSCLGVEPLNRGEALRPGSWVRIASAVPSPGF